MNFPILDIYMCFTQPCLNLCSPKDCSPPGSSVCGIFQAGKAPLSVEFFQQEYWSGLPFPILGNLPNPGIETVSFASLALVDGFFTTSTTWEDIYIHRIVSPVDMYIWLLSFSTVFSKWLCVGLSLSVMML